jgi:L-ascorbate metabolism protein UlaG (beta-lactamase superfamily)
MVRIKNKTILFDPVLSESASPFRFTVQRFQKPILKLSELPPIDYIVISHDHYDHLDRVTSEFFINKDTHFITPLGVSAHLIGWGVPKERVTELDWWGELSIDGLNFVCTPAQHFSGRQGMDGGKTLWSSWIVQDERSRIYFSGDTGYGDHFKEIGKRFGPFDIVFMENGQYNKRWQAVHMMPEEWPQAFKDLQGKHYMPVHWGMFDLSFHSWYEPIVKIDELARMNNFSLLAPKVGEIVDLSTGYHSVKWWENYVR